MAVRYDNPGISYRASGIGFDGSIVGPANPFITFRRDDNPSIQITSLSYFQTKDTDGIVLPVLQGERSNIIRFRIYNNWGIVTGAVGIINCKLTTYDDPSASTQITPPVVQKWVRVQQLGYGEGSSQPGNLTNRPGEDKPVGGVSAVLIPERGSDGSTSPILFASDTTLGFLRFKTLSELPRAVAAASHTTALVFEFDFVT